MKFIAEETSETLRQDTDKTGEQTNVKTEL